MECVWLVMGGEMLVLATGERWREIRNVAKREMREGWGKSVRV